MVQEVSDLINTVLRTILAVSEQESFKKPINENTLFELLPPPFFPQGVYTVKEKQPKMFATETNGRVASLWTASLSVVKGVSNTQAISQRSSGNAFSQPLIKNKSNFNSVNQMK